MEIPELFKAWIGGVLRHVLSGFFAAAAAKGIVTGEQAEMTIVWIIGFVAMLAWSLIQKTMANKKMEQLSALTRTNYNYGSNPQN